MKVTPGTQTLILASESAASASTRSGGRDAPPGSVVTRVTGIAARRDAVGFLADGIPLLEAVPIESPTELTAAGAMARGYRATQRGRAVSLYSSTQQLTATGPTAHRIDVHA